jgi:hypothetical protein
MKNNILNFVLLTSLSLNLNQNSMNISTYHIKISKSNFEISKNTPFSLFSAREMYLQVQNNEYKLLEKAPKQFDCIVYVSFKPLSIIGDNIQYLETSKNDPGKNCSLRNTGNVQVISYDFKSKKNTKITDFFNESDILKTLINNKIILKFLNNNRVGIKSISDLAEKLLDHNKKNCSLSFNENTINNFSFHHQEKDKIAVRIWLSYMCNAVPAEIMYQKGNLQIGLLLKPNVYTKKFIKNKQFIFTKDFEYQKANPTINFYYLAK